MTEISDRTVNIDDLLGSPGDSELLGDAVLDIFQDQDGFPRKIVPTALILHGDVVAWITPPEGTQVTDDTEPVPVHLHSWTIRAAQEAPVTGIVFGKPMPRTLVLATCTDCGEPISWPLAGTWTLEDLRGTEDTTSA